ncbi:MULTISPECIES: NAD(P)-binding protein [unclassified Rhodococcus (in: high G+C Gram-positive bacteria)]|uniref:phytoene desaturase family protein n=1 Tax=Rhodococcus sp. SJ-3 TaxID=3454628 RepID=UPI002DADC0C8|nr:NAD(P)/FAD-dependent oxidoreductase [Rhodococcus sp. (in: high G+C Gram-positive bacteria)]
MTVTGSSVLDAVVIGSGHNALVSACYLAREGWSIEVVERDTVIGGAVSTVERFPGYAVDRGSSAHIMIRHSGILEELDLASHGLRYIDCDPWAFAPPPAGSGRPGIVFRRDLDHTCASIEAACGERDAEAYLRFVREWGPRTAAVMRSFAAPPTARHLVPSFRGLDLGGGALDLSRRFLTSGDALLDEYFDDEPLKAALAWFGAQSGPPMSEPGTAPMVGFAALMHTLPPGRPVGGSGALTQALTSRLASDGGTVTCGDAAVEIRRSGEIWTVRTESGRIISARTVIAGCHILTTLDMLEQGGFDASRIGAWRRRIRVGPGIGMVLRLGTDSLPRYRGAPGDGGDTTGLQLLVDDRAQLRLAHGAALAGELPPTPAVLAMSFSALDPSIAPSGEHQITLWSQWYAYRLGNGRTWRSEAAAETDRIIAEMETRAPGFTAGIRHIHTQTPEDIEREMGLIGGNVMHVEMALDQMFFWRPVPELSGYRVPGTSGMYLTGASMHPGGGVSGSSGRSAARVALADSGGGLLRRTLGRLAR